MGNTCIPNTEEQPEGRGDYEILKIGEGSRRETSPDRDRPGKISVIKISDADEGYYEGEVGENGKRKGYGVQKYRDGRRFEGYWVDDLPHGNGNLYYPSGDVYYGEVITK